ncbi:MAG: nucleotidyl transferase AbiEii/AbiGii toxin family protein, partial [Planctomycetota bacterium]
MLYRLSQSVHADKFVLKGAMLFFTWECGTYRPTRDLDLLARGDRSPSHVEEVFKALCAVGVEDDGLEFDARSVRAEDIREAQEYGGVRVQLAVGLAQARLDLQVDVGFGDALVPKPRKVEFSSLLDFPPATIYAYRCETVISEKFQAMVALGIANSRMKDFYDLWVLARDFEFRGELLCRALKATFRRRKTTI